MRSRIFRAFKDHVLITIDGPVQIGEGEVVIIAVVSDFDQAGRLMNSIDTIDLPHPPRRRTNANVVPRGKR